MFHVMQQKSPVFGGTFWFLRLFIVSTKRSSIKPTTGLEKIVVKIEWPVVHFFLTEAKNEENSGLRKQDGRFKRNILTH